jgi:hypothetical protein
MAHCLWQMVFLCEKPELNMAENTVTNHWKRYHNSLTNGEGKKYKERIEKVLAISQSAFYRKIREPQRFLTPAEKAAIARVYNLQETYLFPELAAELFNGGEADGNGLAAEATNGEQA